MNTLPSRRNRRRLPLRSWLLRAVASLALGVIASLQAPPAHAADIADLQISLDGPASSGWGASETYTWTITNQGPDAGDGAAVTLAASQATLTQASVTCRATGGASCPVFAAAPGGSSTATIGSLPVGGVLTVNAVVVMPATGGSVGVSGSLTPAPGATDPDPATDEAARTTTLGGSVSVTTWVSTTAPALGSRYLWGIVVTNTGGSSLTGVLLSSRYQEYLGSELSTIWEPPTCVSTAGASCPSGLVGGSASGSDWILKDQEVALPPSSTLTFSVWSTTTSSSATCDGKPLVLNEVAATVGGSTWRTTGSVSPRLACNAVVVTSEPSTVAPTLDTPNTWTDTFANRGLDAIIAARLSATVSGQGVQTAWAAPTCVAAGGAVCPTGFAEGSTVHDATLYDVVAPDIPVGGSLIITYSLIHTDPAPSCGNTYGVVTAVSARGPAIASTSAPGAIWPVPLTDAVVEATGSQKYTPGGQPLTLGAMIASACGRIDALPFTWTLPPASGFTVADPVSALVCTATSGSCPAFTFDAATRTLSTVFTQVGPQRYTLMLTGQVGLQPGGIWESSMSASNRVDIAPGTNTSVAYFGVTNTVWPVRVAFRLSPESIPAPDDIVVTGLLRCLAAGSRPWSVTLRAGDDQASSPVMDAWAGDRCTFVADSLPDAPPGLRWSGGLTSTGTSVPSLAAAHQATYTATLVEAPVVVVPPVVLPVTDPPVAAAPPREEATAAAPASALASTGAAVDGGAMLGAGLLLVVGLSLTLRPSRRGGRGSTVCEIRTRSLPRT